MFLILRLATLLIIIGALYACNKLAGPSESIEVAVQGLHAGSLNEDGSLALVASINHSASLWRTTDGERLFDWRHKEGEESTIIATDFEAGNAWAVTAEPNNMVLWDSQNGEGKRFWTAPGEILDISLASQAKFALLGLDTHNAVMFDIQRGGILHTFVHQNRVRSVDLSADASLAVSGSEDFSAVCWDTQSGKALGRFEHGDDVQLVRISSDGKLVLSASKYDKAVVWSCLNGELKGEVGLKAEHLKRGVRFTAARFSHDNTLLLTGRPDQWVELWSLDSMQTIQRWKVPKRDKWKPTSAAILDVAFGENSDEIWAIASNGFIHKLKRKH